MTNNSSPKDYKIMTSGKNQQQIDAGTRSYNHYASKLPKWRYIIRQTVLPLIRAETPPLAKLQNITRSKTLDSYFAFSANLGTHTFFMLFLPILFWCGYDTLGRVLVNLLASGVIVSGIIKDLLCLPRPVSPPLHRITMSGSAALEYGFPSTHSTNAVSVALYAIYLLAEDDQSLSPTAKFMCTGLSYLYAVSITFGRLYCGMHGFTDVVAGSILGALLTLLELQFGAIVQSWVVNGPIIHYLLFTIVILIIVRTHPEPADNCPCFDDSVAFAGVLIGLYLGFWRQGSNIINIGAPFLSIKTLIRLPLGIVVIVSYRALTKPLLLKSLPPLFRVIEDLDLDLPRRYFLKASEYSKVPELLRDDNVLPSPREVSQIFGDVRRRRGRAISIGPQSAADAHELLAYRREEARRRDRSMSSTRSARIDEDSIVDSATIAGGQTGQTGQTGQSGESDPSAAMERNDETALEITDKLEHSGTKGEGHGSVEEIAEVFSSLPRARKRYDVEVVTKLIVYAGIAWLVVEGCPVMFDILGLGTN